MVARPWEYIFADVAEGQVAVGLLILDEPGEAVGDVAAKWLFGLVGLAGGEEGEHAHGGGAGVGGDDARPGAIRR